MASLLTIAAVSALATGTAVGVKQLVAKGPSAPRLPTIPQAPRLGDPAVQRASAEALRRRQRARGFRSTILSRNIVGQGNQALQQTFGA